MAIKIFVVDEKDSGETDILYSLSNDLIKVHNNFKIEEFDNFLPVLKSLVSDIEEFGKDYVKLL